MTVKDGMDAAAGVTALGALVEYLPALAAACSVLWFAIRAYEWARVAWFGKPPRGSV